MVRIDGHNGVLRIGEFRARAKTHQILNAPAKVGVRSKEAPPLRVEVFAGRRNLRAETRHEGGPSGRGAGGEKTDTPGRRVGGEGVVVAEEAFHAPGDGRAGVDHGDVRADERL